MFKIAALMGLSFLCCLFIEQLCPTYGEESLLPTSGLIARDPIESVGSQDLTESVLSESLETVELELAESESNTATPVFSPSLVRRGLPAPIDSPPFPSSEWPIGGTNVIGAPDTSETYLLMKSLHHTELGQFLEKHRIKVYGWVDVGGNISTSKHSNFPAVYGVYANRIDLDQIALNVERIPDTVQRDHIDWGFRFSHFYGIDYRSTVSKGLFSGQLLKKNRQYGYDPVLAYADIYFPKVAQGMNVRIGRFLSIPDIEAQLAPDNYMYTHSLMYGIDVYTQTGILTSTKLSPQWTIQLGLTAGNDVMPWVRDKKLTGLAAIQWISKNNNDSIYLVADTINDGQYAHNNVQEYVATWSHRFNHKIHTKTEGWYMWMNNVPARKLPLGVFKGNRATGFTNAWAIVNYLEFKLSPKDFISVRNEYLDDAQGQRTGAATAYTSHGIGWTHWFNKSVCFRPELRFEHAYQNPSYDNGTKKSQLMFAADTIFRF